MQRLCHFGSALVAGLGLVAVWISLLSFSAAAMAEPVKQPLPLPQCAGCYNPTQVGQLCAAIPAYTCTSGLPCGQCTCISHLPSTCR